MTFRRNVFGRYRSYISYIAVSHGELTVARDQKGRRRSGSFSERDARSLASGKPVVAPDIGFSDRLPPGEGLLGVRTAAKAVAAIEAINDGDRAHGEAARATAPEVFEAAAVAQRLLSDPDLE